VEKLQEANKKGGLEALTRRQKLIGGAVLGMYLAALFLLFLKPSFLTEVAAVALLGVAGMSSVFLLLDFLGPKKISGGRCD
jgi:hypothetical protein